MNRFVGAAAGVGIGLLLLLAAFPAHAQNGSSLADGGRLLMSRQQLTQLVLDLDQIANSSTYSGELRARARQETAIVSARLANGDFSAGDQIELTVEGEPDLTGTLVVQEGPKITVPIIGDVTLRGVLRAELQEYLSEHLAGYLREPRVSARSLTRVAVLGAVGQPGFYVVPSDMVLSEVIMQAGGPTTAARVDRARIERDQREILGVAAVQNAIAQGQSLDRMSLRAGDQIVVPERSSNTLSTVLWGSIPGLLLSVVTAVLLR